MHDSRQLCSKPFLRPRIMTDTDKESTNMPRNQKDNVMSQSQSRVRRLSSVVEKTVDKLSRSVSSSPSRVFSINRKLFDHNQATSRSKATPSNEDSPFIRPASPPLRPKLDPLGSDGSVRYYSPRFNQLLIITQDASWYSDTYTSTSCTAMDNR